MTTVLACVVFVLATARLSRIVTTDKIGEEFRAWTLRRWGSGSLRAWLFHCDWCLGWWIAAVLAWPAAWAAGLPWWWGWGLWPAGSYLVGVLARWDQG